MIAHLRQCLVCPLIPITTVAIDVTDFEQRSELSGMFMNHINQLGIDSWLDDINSLYSSRIRSVCEQINYHYNERLVIVQFLMLLRYIFPKINQILLSQEKIRLKLGSKL